MALSQIGYTHRHVIRMTPRCAYELWLAIPDPELAPKKSDDPSSMMGLVL